MSGAALRRCVPRLVAWARQTGPIAVETQAGCSLLGSSSTWYAPKWLHFSVSKQADLMRILGVSGIQQCEQLHKHLFDKLTAQLLWLLLLASTGIGFGPVDSNKLHHYAWRADLRTV